MPESRSGRRIDRFWKTSASINMPVPAMSHAIIAPTPPVVRAKAAGNAKMPEPIIEPTTSEISATNESVCFCGALMAAGHCAHWRRRVRTVAVSSDQSS